MTLQLILLLILVIIVLSIYFTARTKVLADQKVLIRRGYHLSTIHHGPKKVFVWPVFEEAISIPKAPYRLSLTNIKIKKGTEVSISLTCVIRDPSQAINYFQEYYNDRSLAMYKDEKLRKNMQQDLFLDIFSHGIEPQLEIILLPQIATLMTEQANINLQLDDDELAHLIEDKMNKTLRSNGLVIAGLNLKRTA